MDGVIQLLAKLEGLIEQAPPDPGPRRFGNVAFRQWHTLVRDALTAPENSLLDQHLPAPVLSLQSPPGGISAKEELLSYLAGSFGSPQRLDYGTGHELSFTAFLGGIWVLGGFQPGRDELALALKCYDAYFRLVRKLVLTYTLEPAGSHGVWGLDDHSFLPYIFGSSQLTTHLPSDTSAGATARQGLEGLGDVPKPGDIVQSSVVERERSRNLYFGAVGFIYDVKTGPFWEHSPILFDISGVQGGWGKINKVPFHCFSGGHSLLMNFTQGMIKMFNAEVLGKFPVVQHFPFGSIFSWDGGPVPTVSQTAVGGLHPTGSEHKGTESELRLAGSVPQPTESGPRPSGSRPGSTKVPAPVTAAPWARNPAPPPAIGASSDATTRAPWAKSPAPPGPGGNPGGLPAGRFPPIETPFTARAPPPANFPPSGGLLGHSPPRSVPTGGDDTKEPWATSVADKHPPSPSIIQATEANLGPKRTSSPDSMLATMGGEEILRRRGSLGTGGVRVAETGDLKRK